jgi:tRNA(adenine34) deaminase
MQPDQLSIQDDERWMRRALQLAREAEAAGEVPVGSVIVAQRRMIGEAANRVIRDHDPSAHAEVLALRQAGQVLENYRIPATIYVTLEPCVMCAGALVNARIRRLVFGARDLRFGGVRSKFCLADNELLNHQMQIEEGLLGAECTQMLQAFFQSRR